MAVPPCRRDPASSPPARGAHRPPTCFSPRRSQRRTEGRLPKPSLTPTWRPRCHAPPRECSVLWGEKRGERGENSGAGGFRRLPVPAARFTASPLPRGVETSPSCLSPCLGAAGTPRATPRPAQPGSGQPPPLSAALTAPGRSAHVIDQTAEQPSPALTAPQLCSHVPLQFSEHSLVEKRLYTVSTKLIICYMRI